METCGSVAVRMRIRCLTCLSARTSAGLWRAGGLGAPLHAPDCLHTGHGTALRTFARRAERLSPRVDRSVGLSCTVRRAASLRTTQLRAISDYPVTWDAGYHQASAASRCLDQSHRAVSTFRGKQNESKESPRLSRPVQHVASDAHGHESRVLP